MNEHVGHEEALNYVLKYTSGKNHDAILGFSQGGTLATALALFGHFSNIRAVVTAGSPFVSEVLDAAVKLNLDKNAKGDTQLEIAREIPKLHFAGEKIFRKICP